MIQLWKTDMRTRFGSASGERGFEDGNGGLRMSGAVEEGEPAKKAVQILLEKCSQGRRRIRKVWDQKVKGWA